MENDNSVKYFKLSRKKPQKNTVEHETNGDKNCNWWAGNAPIVLKKGLEELEIEAKIEIIQNTA